MPECTICGEDFKSEFDYSRHLHGHLRNDHSREDLTRIDRQILERNPVNNWSRWYQLASNRLNITRVLTIAIILIIVVVISFAIFDGDSANPVVELQQGTNLFGPDTDGDGLLDSWEIKNETPDGTKLPDSNPLYKDLYVQINYANQTQPPLTEGEKAFLRRFWADIPVDNPNGSEGIRLHIIDSKPYGGFLKENLTYIYSENRSPRDKVIANQEKLYRRFYLGEGAPNVFPEKRRCAYHLSIFVRIEHTPGQKAVARGNLSGKFTIIAGDSTKGNHLVGNTTDDRTAFLTHELLHNILGVLNEDYRYIPDPGHSTLGGIMDDKPERRSLRVPPRIADELEQFEQPDHCER